MRTAARKLRPGHSVIVERDTREIVDAVATNVETRTLMLFVHVQRTDGRPAATRTIDTHAGRRFATSSYGEHILANA